ncbi:MAG: FkbM family methyltransferase [Acetobacteraceae bacterium]
MTFVSYAQNDEDILLWRALKAVAHGFYIDVGAAMVDGFSVSRAFHEHGWRGVNIEPVPEFCAELRATRPEDITLPIALGAADGERDFFTIPGTGLSTLEATIAHAHRADGRTVIAGRIAVATLAGICREYAERPINFLKIDVEGAEAEVLAGADFSRFRPWIIVIEAIRPGRPEPSHAAWEPALIASGYRFAWFDGLNRFYIAAEHEAALAPHFDAPPNVWDAFVRFDRAHEASLTAAHSECGRLRTELAQKAAEIAAASAEAFALRRAFFTEVEAKEALERRLAGSEAEVRRAAEAAQMAVEPPAAPDLVPEQPGPRKVTPRAALKSALRPCWRLARPILRPLAWRTRGFLIRPVQGSLVELRAEQERLAAEIGAAQERLAREMAGEVAAVTMAVEAALLTVAATGIDPSSDQAS